MRLVFVNRFYWPETPATGQLLTDLATALAEAGHEVEVITSAATPATPRHEIDRGVRIHRVRGTRWNRIGVVGKACDFATFFLGAVVRTLRRASRETVVVAMTDPPLLGVGVGWAARLRGARSVHWVQDIYPEIAIALSGHSWLRALRPVRNRAWRRASGCVTLGDDMASVITQAGVAPQKISVIANWALGETATPDATAVATLRREWRLEGKFAVVYSGNLGRVHDLEPVLALAEALRAEGEIAFVFIGAGARRAALESTATQRGLTNVMFLPTQPRRRLAESLALADVHLVTLRPGCEKFVFPSKLYGTAAAERPVLFIGPRECEVARLVRANDLGLAAERDHIDAMADFLRRLRDCREEWNRHAAAARRFSQQHTRERAVRQWCDLLATLGACARSMPQATTVQR